MYIYIYIYIFMCVCVHTSDRQGAHGLVAAVCRYHVFSVVWNDILSGQCLGSSRVRALRLVLPQMLKVD